MHDQHEHGPASSPTCYHEVAVEGDVVWLYRHDTSDGAVESCDPLPNDYAYGLGCKLRIAALEAGFIAPLKHTPMPPEVAA